MKMILLAAISADGYIDGGEDVRSTDWTSDADTRFFVQKTKAAGTVIMGRKTFETFPGALSGRRTIVMTSTPDKFAEADGVEYTAESPGDLVGRLKKEGIASAVLAGGTSVYSQFLQEGLVNEVFLTVEPILFGDGKTLCALSESIDMTLKNVQTLGHQTALLHYSIS